MLLCLLMCVAATQDVLIHLLIVNCEFESTDSNVFDLTG